jgi:hypothetical protein
MCLHVVRLTNIMDTPEISGEVPEVSNLCLVSVLSIGGEHSVADGVSRYSDPNIGEKLVFGGVLWR